MAIKYRIPQPGEIWEKDGRRRIIIKYDKLVKYSDGRGDVLWQRGPGEKVYRIWLPNWHKWEINAKRIFINNESIIDLPQLIQRQDSLHEQMSDLEKISVKFGLYDAHDWILQNYFEKFKIKK